MLLGKIKIVIYIKRSVKLEIILRFLNGCQTYQRIHPQLLE